MLQSKRGKLSILETLCCRGDTNATRRTNFRIRLLTGCDGLEQDASHFRYRTQGRSSGDPTCKLCGLGPENAEHFITNCHSLDAARNFALELAPPQVCPHLPNPARDPVVFSDVILGIDWIDHRPTQLFINSRLPERPYYNLNHRILLLPIWATLRNRRQQTRSLTHTSNVFTKYKQ